MAGGRPDLVKIKASSAGNARRTGVRLPKKDAILRNKEREALKILKNPLLPNQGGEIYETGLRQFE